TTTMNPRDDASSQSSNGERNAAMLPSVPSLAAPFSYGAAGEAFGAALLDLGRFRLSSLREIYHRLLAGRGCFRGSGPDVGAVGQHFPLASIGPHLDIDHDAQLLAQLRVLDGRDNLDATLEIALHAIGGADKKILRSAIAKIIDAAVFEEPANDAHHAHVFRQPLDSRSQPAGVADYQIDLHARLRRAIQSPRYVHVLECVHLELN